MDADWSVELGADDAVLEFPWSSPDGAQCYLDLRRHPELRAEIPEAVRFPELGEFLLVMNGPTSPWLTAKCDLWFDDELDEAEAIYHAKQKFCAYVDLVLREDDARFSFSRHEQCVKSAARALASDDELPVACEFIVRRCWYHTETNPLRAGDDAETPGKGNPVPGFYLTFYVFGYGDDHSQARVRWGEGLRRAAVALAVTSR